MSLCLVQRRYGLLNVVLCDFEDNSGLLQFRSYFIGLTYISICSAKTELTKLIGEMLVRMESIRNDNQRGF